MIEVDRQLTPALDFLTGNVSDHFLGGGLNDKVTVMTVFKAQELVTVLGPAARLLPEFSRLNDRHEQFNRAGIIHFLADNVFNLTDGAQTNRHVVVDAGGKLLDHPGTDGKLHTGNVGISGRFFERRNKVGTGSHNSKKLCWRISVTAFPAKPGRPVKSEFTIVQELQVRIPERPPYCLGG